MESSASVETARLKNSGIGELQILNLPARPNENGMVSIRSKSGSVFTSVIFSPFGLKQTLVNLTNMGRSVSVPSGAEAVVYLQYECEAEDDDQDAQQWAWQDYRECIAETLKKQFPSLVGCKGWLGNEERIFLENRHANVVIAEYCGCVSVSLVPKYSDDHYSESMLHKAWCRQVAKGFEAVLEKGFPDTALKRLGHMSNGCSVYELASTPGSCVTSNEGRLW